MLILSLAPKKCKLWVGKGSWREVCSGLQTMDSDTSNSAVCSTVIYGKIPTRCVNAGCLSSLSHIIRAGFSGPILSLHGKRRQRFKCTRCGFKFSENFEKLHYRLKHKDPSLNSKIFQLFIHGLSNRKISRFLGISPHSTRIRLTRLSQRALEFHHQSTKDLFISEAICFDGLENFAYSQYEPNNINQAIGKDSLFIYDFNFAPLNRKGRMSPWQKLRNAEIVNQKGRFNPKAVRVASRDIIERLYDKRMDESTALLLISDEHFQYRRVIQQDLKSFKINHLTISSKAVRNYQNILFSVNHADLLIRKAIAPFARETISFSKTHGQMCQKFALFMVYKNYMVPQFTKAHKGRVNADRESPAQNVGISSKMLDYSDIFSLRSMETVIKTWNEDWKSFWRGLIPAKHHRSFSFV